MLQSSYRIQQEDRVAILALNSPAYLDALFACARLGAILVPLNWRLTVRELVTILLDCEPKALAHDGLLGSPTDISNVRSLLRMNKRHEATTGVPTGHAGTI